jgi:hypothetical protein
LPFDFSGKGCVYLPVIIFINIIPQAVVAVAVVDPAWVVNDGIKAYALYGNAVLDRSQYLAGDIF